MAVKAPTVSDIRSAKESAVGGGRKRCKRGKNCSAACIAGNEACLVEMPESAGVATTKVRNMLMQRMGGKMPAPAAPTSASLRPSPEDQALKSQAKGILREEKAAKPAKPTLQDLSKRIGQAREEYEGAYGTSGQAAAKAKFDKAVKDYEQAKAKSNEPKTGRLLSPAEVLAKPKQYRSLAQTPAEGEGQSWRGKFAGRTPTLDAELASLQAKINKLPPDQQSYWNEQINKQMNPKLASRNGTPYSAEKTNRSLTSQAKAWNYLVENGQPQTLMNRIGETRPAPKGMIPDVTSSGQRKWISPDDGLKYSLNKGNWRQNRVSKADTDRRLPDITSFRKEQQAAGAAWPTQKLPAREGLKSVDEIIKGLSPSDKSAIVFNGLDATGNEGVKLRQYYNSNPAEKDARLREIVQRWHDQGGRSGVSGKPVALPGMEPKKGEERSSVDHFQPISTNRAAALPAAEMRRIADNYKNFLIAEEGPNSQRGARTWDSWLDKREAAPKPKAVRAPSTKALTEDQREKVETAARMTNFRIDKRLNERQFYDDATNAKIKAANQEVVAPYQKLKPNEKAALSLYGQDGVKYYQQVNQMLRTGQMEDSTPEKVKMAEFIGGNLRSGLAKLPPAKAEELGRAVSGNYATSLSRLKPGDVIEDKGFGSYTNKGNPVYDQFFKKDQPNAAIRILNPKSAREVAPIMEYSTEGEHISMPGTRYRLVDVQEQGVYSRKTGGYIPQYTFEEVEG